MFGSIGLVRDKRDFIRAHQHQAHHPKHVKGQQQNPVTYSPETPPRSLKPVRVAQAPPLPTE
jgi:hypothetical protein